MKLKFVAAAVAALAAGQAFAAPINPTRVIYISGASAQDATLRTAVASALCQSGTVQNYTLNGSNSNHSATYCTTLNTTALPGTSDTGGAADTNDIRNERLLVVKRSSGGSAFGIAPVAGRSDDANGVSVDANGAIEFINPATCDDATLVCTGTHQHRAQAGLSDVEAALFGTPTTGLAVYPSIGLQGFGVGISEALYDHLISVRGSATLAKAEVAALLSDNPDYATFEFITGSTNQVEVCRRPESSGTQRSSNAYFLGQNCVADTTALVAASAASPAGRIVSENSSSGNARTCLVNADAAGRYAIGVLSLENAENQSASGANGWRYASISGVSPIVDPLTGGSDATTRRRAIIEGTYDFAYEAVAYRATSLPAASGAEVGVGHVQAIMDAITINMRATSGTPLAGIAIVPGTVFYDDDSTQVARYGRGGNSCAPLGRI